MKYSFYIACLKISFTSSQIISHKVSVQSICKGYLKYLQTNKNGLAKMLPQL